jgi:phage-related minor tail protein
MAGLGIDAGILNILIAPKLVEDFAATLGGQLETSLTPLAEKAGTDFGASMGKSISKTGAKITAGLTLPILALGALAIKSATQMDDAFDSVRVKTGLTGKAFDSLTESMKNVSKVVPQSLGEIGNIMSDITIKTGLTGKPLEALTTQFAQFNKVTGKDLNIKDTLDAFSLLGVKSSDYGKTLDKVLRASQIAGVGADELTGQLKGQASTLNALGFSFDKSLGFITTFSKAGLDTGAIFAGFKKAVLASTKSGEDYLKLQADLSDASSAYAKAQLAESSAIAKLNEVRANSKSSTADIIIAENNLKAVRLDMNNIDLQRIDLNGKIVETTKSLTTAQKDAPAFFDETIKKIKEYLALGNETEALKVASVFGKSAIGIIDAIKQGGFEIAAVYDKIAFGSETIADVYKSTVDFTDQLSIFKKRTAEAFGDVGLKLFPALEKALDKLLPPIEKFIDAFSKLDPNVQAAIIGALAFAAAIGPIVTTVGAAITAFAALSTLAAGLGIALGALVATAALVVVGIVAIGAIIYILYKYRDSIKQAFGDSINWVKDKWDKMTTYIADKITSLINIVKNIVKPIKDAFTNITGSIGNILGGVFEIKFDTKLTTDMIKGIFGSISGTAIQVSNEIQGIFGNMANTVKAAFNSVIGYGQNVAQSIVTYFVGMVNHVSETMKRLFDYVGGLINNIGHIFALMRNGMVDAFNTIINTVFGIIQKIVDFIAYSINGIINLISKIPGVGTVLNTVPGRALGGPVEAGQTYMVGEKGPELFVPQNSGTIIPNDTLSNMSSGGGSQPTYNIVINNPVAEESSLSIPAALRKANYLRT